MQVILARRKRSVKANYKVFGLRRDTRGAIIISTSLKKLDSYLMHVVEEGERVLSGRDGVAILDVDLREDEVVLFGLGSNIGKDED